MSVDLDHAAAQIAAYRRAKREEQAQEALSRARGGLSMANWVPIITEFAARGIPMADIRPRENVFTYRAWLALGRQVRKGEKGVQCVTFVPVKEKEQAPEEQPRKRRSTRPTTAYVFHVSQTDPIEGK